MTTRLETVSRAIGGTIRKEESLKFDIVRRRRWWWLRGIGGVGYWLIVVARVEELDSAAFEPTREKRTTVESWSEPGTKRREERRARGGQR